MRIDEIKINGFGKIKDKAIELKDGINVIYGGNEAGKSTLLKCMQALLYGVAKTKNGKELSDFDRYQPWDNAEFSGKIKYTLDNGEEYEVFRDFKKKNPIIYQGSEDISKNFKANKSKGIPFLEEQIGMDEASFCKTAIIGQQEVKLEKSDTNSMIQKISNLVSSGDDNISFKKSMESLSKQQNERIGTERTKEKPMNIVDHNIKKLLDEKRALKIDQQNVICQDKEKEYILTELKELQEKKENLKSKKENFQDDQIKNIETEFKMKIFKVIFVILIVIAVFLFAILKNMLVLIPVALAMVDIFIMFKIKRKMGEMTGNLDVQKVEKEIENIENKMNDLKLKQHILDTEKANMDEKLEKLARIEEELEEQKRVKDELVSLEISYHIARECLEKAYDEIKHNLSPKFEQKLCEITSDLTNGKYQNISVNDETGLVIEVENGAYMPVSRLSLGTIDEMYLALRLSILAEICEENLPILLDETFAYFDDTRLKNMMCYLQDKNYDHQIIIFTCTDREEEVLNRLKIEYHLINLEK